MLCIGLFFCAAPGVASRYGATDHSAVAVRLLHAFVQFLGLEAEGGDWPRLQALEADLLVGLLAVSVLSTRDAR